MFKSYTLKTSGLLVAFIAASSPSFMFGYSSQKYVFNDFGRFVENQRNKNKYDQVNIGDRHVVRMRQCFDSRKNKVVFKPRPAITEAWAIIDGSYEPAIVIPETFVKNSSKLATYVESHECGHHFLGHIHAILDNGVIPDKKVFQKYEREADCFAVIDLTVNFNFTIDDFREIYQSFAKNGTDIHGTREERVKVAQACLGQYASYMQRKQPHNTETHYTASLTSPAFARK